MKQSLNFNWKFSPDYKEEYLKSFPAGEYINIPHSAKQVPYNYFDEKSYQIISTYEKIFDVDEDIKNKSVILRFDGFMLKAKIYLNGVDLGEHISGYVQVKLDVSKYIKQTGNRLLVILDSREDSNIPPFGYAVDYLTFSGIYREVFLEIHPKNYLDNIFVKSTIEGDIKVSYDKIGEVNNIKHEVYFNDKRVKDSDVDEFKIDNPNLWDLDNPNLYVLKTIIDGETYVTRFGIRKALFKKGGFYLNNKKVKLIGLNRHQGYPFVGYAMPKSAQEEDAEILKYKLGLNIVRQSHYPQSEHFLNRCDEIGLLTIDEIPGWQHISKEESWRNTLFEFTIKMVISQRNHPSLIAHGVRIDESQDDHDLYIKTNEIAHNLDNTRQTLGVRNFKGSELLEDIYAYNDFSCSSLKSGLVNKKKIYKGDKPYLVTEYMGHMDPVKATSDEVIKSEVAQRHARVIDDNYKYSDISGAIGWCAFDYHTHVDFGCGDHICPHGVCDLYRNLKHSAYSYSSQNSKTPILEVISNMKPGDYAEARYYDIHVATNCDYFDLYKNDEFVKRYYPNKDIYKYMPHPLVKVDDIVGETFKESRFPKKTWPKIAKMLSHAAIDGFTRLTLKEKLYLIYSVVKYKSNYAEVVDLYNKHVGSWGGIAKTYTYKGYINDKLVITKRVGPSTAFDLEVTPYKTKLVNKETYDCTRIAIRYIDENGSTMQYANKVVSIDYNGPITILGDRHQSLLGGQLSLYVLSKNEKGKAKIKISVESIVKEVELTIE